MLHVIAAFSLRKGAFLLFFFSNARFLFICDCKIKKKSLFGATHTVLCSKRWLRNSSLSSLFMLRLVRLIKKKKKKHLMWKTTNWHFFFNFNSSSSSRLLIDYRKLSVHWINPIFNFLFFIAVCCSSLSWSIFQSLLFQVFTIAFKSPVSQM